MKLSPIVLNVDVGYDVDEVSHGYVEAFNKSGGAYTILNYHTREPLQGEVAFAKKYADRLNAKLVQDGEDWLVISKQFDGTVIKKKIFVLVVTRMSETPEHLMSLRPKVKPPERIEIPPEEDKS